MLNPLDPHAVERLVRSALEEDAPWGDLTSQTLVPMDARATASLVAREPGVLSGTALFRAAMQLTDPDIQVSFTRTDGERFNAGEVLAEAGGSARSVLQAERVGLNLVQRLSGIATLTARFVDQVAGTRARIVDTRKTTPGLRYFERYAVRCGGGFNHRFSLSDAVLLKDNHLAVLAAHASSNRRLPESSPPERSAKPGAEGPGAPLMTPGAPLMTPGAPFMAQSHRAMSGVAPAQASTAANSSLTAALLAARAQLPHTTHLEVEVDRPDQIEPVLAAGVDTILLDNFSLEDMRKAVEQINGRALVEASGSVNLDTVAAIARTGVDLISVGALTHSVRSLDLGLDILPRS